MLQDRIRDEQAFHDRQAQSRWTDLRACPDDLIVRDDEYLEHEPWIRPALDALGDLRGRRILDFGCGHGMAAVVLARRGARVTAFDLSGGYVFEASALAVANGVNIAFVQANGEQLPFADETFDCIWGNAVLHHLDLDRAGRELHRVLRAGGVAVFCEPWAGNPVLNWARRYLPYRGKQRTPDEAPLTSDGIKRLRKFFPRLEVAGCQLFSMVSRVCRNERVVRTLDRWDGKILGHFPGLSRWCRYVILTLRTAGQGVTLIR